MNINNIYFSTFEGEPKNGDLELPETDIFLQTRFYDPQVATVITANGRVAGQRFAKAKKHHTISWPYITAELWQDLECWFDDFGSFFYYKYYEHGKWNCLRYRLISMACKPWQVKDKSLPGLVYEVNLEVEDAG